MNSAWTITVAARSKARNFFPRPNTGVMGSNPTRAIDVCLQFFPVFVLSSAGCGLATG